MKFNNFHSLLRRSTFVVRYSAVRPCIPQQLAQKLQLDTLECLVGNFYYLTPASDACV
jgi:hypothetical protein